LSSSAIPEPRVEDDVAGAAQRLEGAPPEAVLAWAVERFGARLGFATGFGPEGCVVLDLLARHRLALEVFTLDTGLLFRETHKLWRLLEERYGITIHGVRPALGLDEQTRAHGDRLWERDPDRCCALRKLEPLGRALHGYDAWVSAIRRDQTPERAAAKVVERDPRFGRVKVNPLVSWSSEQVWDYVREHDVPVNLLHAFGYPSIGCWPCTSAVRSGEDPRAGRWRGTAKTECGLHVSPGSRPAAVPALRPEGSLA
jgi:phosphoadenosine phosphosulfate reductase